MFADRQLFYKVEYIRHALQVFHQPVSYIRHECFIIQFVLTRFAAIMFNLYYEQERK